MTTNGRRADGDRFASAPLPAGVPHRYSLSQVQGFWGDDGMKLTGNTILITGGGTGIGRGLAEAFHGQGDQVIIAGRRKAILDEVTAANPGMACVQLDVTDKDALTSAVALVVKHYPTLNVLINDAGIMRPEDVKAPDYDLADAEAIVATNLIAPLRLTAALLPYLMGQPTATIINVSSGLAFVPMARTLTYCATKAAIHSYTQSLRYQLRGTSVEVKELIPPYVQTDLMNGADDPRAMPLDAFIAEVMAILKTDPDGQEILVKAVHGLRFAERNGTFDQVFGGMNGAFEAG